MKKIIVTLVLGMAAVAFAAAPAAADIKLTTKGYMQVQGLYQSGFLVENDGFEGSNNWYNMEMILQPTLHINDKVRIHAQIRMMERNYSGTVAGDEYITNAAEDKYNIFGDEQNNFWLERLFIAFPAFGGQFQIGRRSGGNWAHEFADSDQNRDRILYLRSFGPFTFLGLVEKRDESDGGLAAPRWNNLVNPSYTRVDADQDAYALGAVLPFSKNIILRPLWYGIRDGNGFLGGNEPNWQHIFMLGGIYKFGPVRFEHEIQYWTGETEGDEAAGGGRDITGWGVWAGVGFNFGPLSVDVNGFWLEGGDNDFDSKDRVINLSTGQRFQPLLLTFSEDMGFLFDSSGVANGSADFAQSGYLCFYVPVSFKISDDMKVGGVFGWIEADEMVSGSKLGGGTADEGLGWEVDVNFTWRFLDNISYIMDAGYFSPGDYWEDATGLSDQSVYGIRNTIKVEW